MTERSGATGAAIVPRRRGRPLGAVAGLSALLPVGFVGLSIVHALAPQRGGPLALSQIFAPHLFAVTLLVAPLAFLSPTRTLRLALSVALAVGAVRFGPGLISLPAAADPGAATLSITSWNLEAGEPATDGLLALIGGLDADVVVLQELTPRHADAMTGDQAVRERFPFFVFRDRPGVTGIGIISRYRILDSSWLDDPSLLRARLDVDGRPVQIVTVHPLPASIGTSGRILYAYDASMRDAALRTIRAEIEPLLASGEPLVVAGDFNVTDREPAYAEVSAGLRDAFGEAGSGIGSTWRPSSLEWLPVGLLRIDHLFSSPDLRPLRYHADCTPRGSDHCVVSATFQL